MSFEDYLEDRFSETTRKAYQRSVDKFLDVYPEAEQLEYKDILHYLSLRNIRRTVDLSAIKCYYHYLIENRQRDDHPCHQLTIRQLKKDVQFQDLFSVSELEQLLKRENRYRLLDNRNKCIISLMIYQALPAVNILNLKVNDVYLEYNRIRVRSTPRLKRRTLELRNKQIPSFRNYIKKDRQQLKSQPTEYLFLSKSGSPMSNDSFSKLIRSLKDYYPDRHLTARSIRQSVLANWINSQHLPVEQAMDRSGQKWLSTTLRYQRSEMHSKVQKVNEFFPEF